MSDTENIDPANDATDAAMPIHQEMPDMTSENEVEAVPTSPQDAEDAFAEYAALFGQAKAELNRVVFGQEQVIDELLISLLSGGHALLVGAPGLAKTLLVTSTATVLGLDSNRVQFTPDLMPSDILGAEILDTDKLGKRAFKFLPGPVFCQLLMADEINRASPRTQSALLQAMQEREVSIAGQTRDLPAPFHVLATQNPIDQEGTYPLPEAQMDRFLLQINVDYPDYEAERQMLRLSLNNDQTELQPVMDGHILMKAQKFLRDMPIGEAVIDRILELVRKARPEEGEKLPIHDLIKWGPGPRASQALSLAARARALVDGRMAPSVDDVAALAAPILRHRMAASPLARAQGMDNDAIVAELLSI